MLLVGALHSVVGSRRGLPAASRYPESKLNEADLASLENTGRLSGAQFTPKDITTSPAGDWPSCEEYWAYSVMYSFTEAGMHSTSYKISVPGDPCKMAKWW